jgi:hypothetical protein
MNIICLRYLTAFRQFYCDTVFVATFFRIPWQKSSRDIRGVVAALSISSQVISLCRCKEDLCICINNFQIIRQEYLNGNAWH